MSKNNTSAWKTKYGPRRVRVEMPSLAEAITAAQGLTDDIDGQVDIAASLMGLPHDQVRDAVLKAAPLPKEPQSTVMFAGPATAPRTVVVERKTTRRVIPMPSRDERPVRTAPIVLRPRSMSR